MKKFIKYALRHMGWALGLMIAFFFGVGIYHIFTDDALTGKIAIATSVAILAFFIIASLFTFKKDRERGNL